LALSHFPPFYYGASFLTLPGSKIIVIVYEVSQNIKMTEERLDSTHPLDSLAKELPGAFPHHRIYEDDQEHSNAESKEAQRELESPLRLLEQRKEMGYRPGIDDDGHTIGLAMDPGGYTGIVGLAMAKELADAGLLDYVDGYYGLSVGGVNAAYTATRQFEDGFKVYKDLMPGRFTRRFSLKVDLGVVEQAIEEDTPLKTDRFNEHAPIVLGATRLEDFKPLIIRSNQMTPEEFKEWMLRCCHLPYIAGPPPMDKDGNHYSDSTLSWLSPIELAQKDGCTDVISLANAVADKPPKKSKITTWSGKIGSKAALKAADAFINKHDPDATAQDIMLASLDEGRYERLIKFKEEAQKHFKGSLFEDNGTVVERIYPLALKDLPELLTDDRRRLIIGQRAGELAVKRALDSSSEAVAA